MVDSYFRMLASERAGVSYNKSENRNAHSDGSRASFTQPALRFSRQSPARTASLSLRRDSAIRIRR